MERTRIVWQHTGCNYFDSFKENLWETTYFFNCIILLGFLNLHSFFVNSIKAKRMWISGFKKNCHMNTLKCNYPFWLFVKVLLLISMFRYLNVFNNRVRVIETDKEVIIQHWDSSASKCIGNYTIVPSFLVSLISFMYFLKFLHSMNSIIIILAYHVPFLSIIFSTSFPQFPRSKFSQYQLFNKRVLPFFPHAF